MKMTYTKSRPETIFQLLTFIVDLFFNVKWGILLQRAYVSFSSPLLLILRWEITNVAVALFFYIYGTMIELKMIRPVNKIFTLVPKGLYIYKY